VYIDPRTPRHLGTRGRAAKARAIARQRAAEARSQKFRLLVHGVIMILGVWGFKHTDIQSEDPFESSTLVLMDMIFCIYLLMMVFIESWRIAHK
jgi:hypothetical protein